MVALKGKSGGMFLKCMSDWRGGSGVVPAQAMGKPREVLAGEL